MSVNKVIVLGNLGDDPELRSLPSGDAVVNFSVASTERWNDNNGERQEHTEWIRCSAFGKTAEVIAEWFGKGSEIYLEGRLRTRKYQDQDGNDRYATEVKVDQFSFTGGSSRHQDGGRDDRGYQQERGGGRQQQTRGNARGGNRQSGGRSQGGGQRSNGGGSRGGSGNYSRNQQQGNRQQDYGGQGGFEEMDDDIPF
jgi:single-strand DNA-binding protein